MSRRDLRTLLREYGPRHRRRGWLVTEVVRERRCDEVYEALCEAMAAAITLAEPAGHA